MVVKSDICFVCKKKIKSDAVRCPKKRKYLHAKCMKKHVRTCFSYHRKVKWRKKKTKSKKKKTKKSKK